MNTISIYHNKRKNPGIFFKVIQQLFIDIYYVLKLW